MTVKQILKMAKYITSYNGYDLYQLGSLLLKHNPKTGIVTGTVLTSDSKNAS